MFDKASLPQGEITGSPLGVDVGECVAEMLKKNEEEGIIDVELEVKYPYNRYITQVVRV